MPKFRSPLTLAPLLALAIASPFAQADDVSADKLAQALGVPGLQVKAVPKRRPQQVNQDYAVSNSKGEAIAAIIQAPPASFADWKQLPDFKTLSGLGQEAYERPEMSQTCARGTKYAACLTLMPGAFPAGKQPSQQQIKAALTTLI